MGRACRSRRPRREAGSRAAGRARGCRDELADLGALAERHVHVDPSSATVKLRTFAEQIVLFIYHQHGLPRQPQSNLNDLLTGASFNQAVPRVILRSCTRSASRGTRRLMGNRSRLP